MKILYLHHYFNTPEMSGGTRSYEMARRLVAAGHEVHMVTSWRRPDKSSQDWFETNEAGIHVHWLPVPYSNHMSYGERIRAFFRFAHQAGKKAKELRGDIVFATSTPLTIAIPAVSAIKKLNIPMVFEVRDLWPELPIAIGALTNPAMVWAAKKLERWAYKHSSAVVALSPGMKEGVIKAGYSQAQIATIPNSSDNVEFAYNETAAAEFRNQRFWLGDRPLLVYTGTFGKINGVTYLAELAQALLAINPEIRILLVGGGREDALLKSRATELGVLDKNLFIEDRIPKKKMPAVLSAATMACSLVIDMPEMRPNSANKFFDALAAGKPIMINYGGWQDELINKHDCGISLWQKPINEAALKLAEHITDKTWLQEAGNASRLLAEEYFDRDKLAAQLEQVLIATAKSEEHTSELQSRGHLVCRLLL